MKPLTFRLRGLNEYNCSNLCSTTAACSSKYDFTYFGVNNATGVSNSVIHYLAKTSLVENLQFCATTHTSTSSSSATEQQIVRAMNFIT